MSLVFNNTYLKEQLLPKYTKFKLLDWAAYNDINMTKFQKVLLNF